MKETGPRGGPSLAPLPWIHQCHVVLEPVFKFLKHCPKMDLHLFFWIYIFGDSLQAIVSMRRIQAFLQLDELTDSSVDRDNSVEGKTDIIFGFY